MNRDKSHLNGDNLKNLVASPSKPDASTREEITGLKYGPLYLSVETFDSMKLQAHCSGPSEGAFYSDPEN